MAFVSRIEPCSILKRLSLSSIGFRLNSPKYLWNARHAHNDSSKENLGSKEQNQRKEIPSDNNKAKIFLGLALLGGAAYAAYKLDWVDSVSLSPKSNAGKIKKTLETSKDIPKVVPQIDGLPESIQYLIVGGGAASFAAFRSIRSHNPKAKVLVVSEEEFSPYMKPPLSKELWFSDDDLAKRLSFRQWNGAERSVHFEKAEFYCPVKDIAAKETGGVALVSGHKVLKVDAKEHKAYLDSGQVVTYEKCLLATGGSPKSLPVFDNASQEVKSKLIYFRSAKDFLNLYNTIEQVKSITIIGGGFLGSELACALGRRSNLLKQKLTIHQVFPEEGTLSKVLPAYLSKWAMDKVKAEGVTVLPSTNVTSVESSKDGVTLKLDNGDSVTSDLILVAVGTDPNTELAGTSKLELDASNGGFLVNAELEARTDLWVAGDSSSFYDVNFGRRRVEHHDHAIVSGKLAGENMTGAHKPYWHQSMFWSDLGPEVGFEAIGLVDPKFQTVGVFGKPTPKDTTQENLQEEGATSAEPRAPVSGDDFERGLIFYLRDKVIVGIVLWNVFNRINLARRIINEGKEREDLTEVAKLFNIYGDED
ncbi:Apoptosis-inducing factor 1, mitochondrial [Halotydeus destructor]|nr:Apoptosis-inducing factor 1, mitochondrial [Halotydeus destructor]